MTIHCNKCTALWWSYSGRLEIRNLNTWSWHSKTEKLFGKWSHRRHTAKRIYYLAATIHTQWEMLEKILGHRLDRWILPLLVRFGVKLKFSCWLVRRDIFPVVIVKLVETIDEGKCVSFGEYTRTKSLWTNMGESRNRISMSGFHQLSVTLLIGTFLRLER